MDKHQKEYIAKKVQTMNPEWLKTGKFSDHLEKINLINNKIFRIIKTIPRTLKIILLALVIANIGIYLKLLYELFL